MQGTVMSGICWRDTGRWLGRLDELLGFLGRLGHLRLSCGGAGAAAQEEFDDLLQAGRDEQANAERDEVEKDSDRLRVL